MKKLGVNIDHVATLRNVRRGTHPDPVGIALLCQLAGADNITFHLREDRRHIQDSDVEKLQKQIQIPLNFEMAATQEMVNIASKIKPAVVTLVPEKREELTTEGGLNLIHQKNILQKCTDQLLGQGIAVSYFIEPSLSTIDMAKQMGASAVEIHTGKYCHEFATHSHGEILQKIQNACDHAFELGLDVHAGHGLDLKNLVPLIEIQTLTSYQIGHAIISDALMYGIEKTIGLYKQAINPM